MDSAIASTFATYPEVPIRLRVALLVSVATTVLVAIGGTFFVASLGTGVHQTLQRALLRRAGRVEAQVTARLLPLATRQARVVPSQDQSLVQVLNAHNHVEYTTGSAGRGSLLTPNEAARALHALLWLQVQRPDWRSPRLILATRAPSQGTQPPPIVVVGSSLDPALDATKKATTALLWGGPFTVLLAGLAAWLLARGVLSPVERLRATAATLSGLDEGRLPVPNTHDELAALACTFNSVWDRLHAALAQQRDFVAAASHELRTPLASLQVQLEFAQRPNRTQQELREAVDAAADRVGELCTLTQRLLLLSQGDEGALALHRSCSTLEPVILRRLEIHQRRAEQLGIVFVFDAVEPVTAYVDEVRLAQVLDNLIDNALDFAPRNSCVRVALRTKEGGVIMEVVDDGPGFPPLFLPRAFDRFARFDPARARGAGTGLGLSIVRVIAQAHGGHAYAGNVAGGGAVVGVWLPAGDVASRCS